MKNVIRFSCILSLFCIFSAQAAIYTSQTTGDWNTASSWDNGVPQLNNNDVVVISTGNTITKTGDITVNNKITFEIYGALIIDGILEVRNNLELIIYTGGTLSVNGISADQNAKISISGGGTATVLGDLTTGNNADVTVDGSLTVDGNISVGNNSTLQGNGTVSVGGSCNDAGTGTFCDSGPLPIELISFTANAENNVVNLKWSTASELNNDYFTLEKSRNGRDFAFLTEIRGSGTKHTRTDYSFEDRDPHLGLSYYRLAQTDFDGTSEVFSAVSILFNPGTSLRVYPNPVRNSNCRIESTGFQKNEMVRLNLYNNDGQLVFSEMVKCDPFGNLDTNLTFQPNWKQGTYFIELISSSGGKQHMKVHKE